MEPYWLITEVIIFSLFCKAQYRIQAFSKDVDAIDTKHRSGGFIGSPTEMISNKAG
jgi:hypothetical protein